MDHSEQKKEIIESFKQIENLSYHDGCIYSLALIPSPNESPMNRVPPKYLISCSDDSTIRIYNLLLKKKELFEYKGTRGFKSIFYFSLHEVKYLLSIDEDGGLHVFEVKYNPNIVLELKQKFGLSTNFTRNWFPRIIKNVHDPLYELITPSYSDEKPSLYILKYRRNNSIPFEKEKVEIGGLDNGGKIWEVEFSEMDSNILYFGGGNWSGSKSTLKKLNWKNKKVEKEFLKDNENQILSLKVMKSKINPSLSELIILGTSEKIIYVFENEVLLHKIKTEYILCIDKLNSSFVIMGTGYPSYHNLLMSVVDFEIEKVTTTENQHSNDIDSIICYRNQVFSSCYDGQIKIWELKNNELDINEFELNDLKERIEYLILENENEEVFSRNSLVKISLPNLTIRSSVVALFL